MRQPDTSISPRTKPEHGENREGNEMGQCAGQHMPGPFPVVVGDAICRDGRVSRQREVGNGDSAYSTLTQIQVPKATMEAAAE